MANVNKIDSDAIVISGLGAHSSFGGIVQTAAAFRCGLSREQELPDMPYFDEETRDENLLIGIPATGITYGFQGIGRFLKMGVCALADMQRYSSLADLNTAKLGVFVVFPTGNGDPASQGKDTGTLLTRLLRLSRIKVEAKNTRAYFEGRVGVVSAIREAQELLDCGQMDYCLIGSIDSLLDSQRLSDLVIENKVKTVDNPIGPVPGEAACFILIERLNSAKRRGVNPEAVLYQPSRAASLDEKESEPLPTGRGLSEVMVNAFKNARVTQEENGTIYCDLNGDTFKAADFGNALVRTSSIHPLGSWKQEIPAVSFGDTGAASGILAICLATRAFSRGYSFGDKAIVVMSERRDRGAIVFGRFENGASF